MIESSLQINSKLPGIEQSIFSTMSAMALKHNAINLAQGFPDFDCDPILVDLVNKAMKEGHNQYAPMPGILALREKIAQKIKSVYNLDCDPNTEICVTSGATQGIYTVIGALVKDDDEVIIFEPAYDSYIPAIRMHNGKPRYVTMNPPNYEIDWKLVEKLISSKTKMIIINSPHNPTGKIFSENDIKTLIKIVHNTEIIILSDEVYEHITFDGQVHKSLLQYPELAMRTMAVSSFGKTYHTTGWKTGYVVGPKVLMDEFKKVYSYSMFSANTPIQHAYAEILNNPAYYKELSAFYQKKRDLFLNEMSKSKFNPLPTEGAYFQLFDYANITQEEDFKFAVKLIEKHKVASIPVSAFYHDKIDKNILRFCFAKKDEVLIEAAKRLCKI
jgi:methionine aminotransferase